MSNNKINNRQVYSFLDKTFNIQFVKNKLNKSSLDKIILLDDAYQYYFTCGGVQGVILKHFNATISQIDPYVSLRWVKLRKKQFEKMYSL